RERRADAADPQQSEHAFVRETIWLCRSRCGGGYPGALRSRLRRARSASLRAPHHALLVRGCAGNENVRGRQQATATGVRGWERLARRKLLTLYGRLQGIVVAVRAAAFLERHPPQH